MNGCRLDVTPAAAVALALVYYLDDSGWFSAAIPAILCHESGHWIAIRALGGRVTALRVELAGICMESTGLSERSSELLALAAGPLAGLLWAAAASGIGGTWGEKSAVASLALNLYNLLPSLPLDGGRMLLTLTGSVRLLRWSGAATAAALFFAAIRGQHWALLLPALLLSGQAVRT